MYPADRRFALNAALERAAAAFARLDQALESHPLRALGAEVPFEPEVWIPLFLKALADEAADYLQLLYSLERAWFTARAAAVDVLAVAPLVSATTLAAGLDMAVKNAIALLDVFAEAEIIVEVTHRSKRRLFGLAGLAPMRDEVAPPPRPEPGRGQGRPRSDDLPKELVAPTAPPPLSDRPLTPIGRKAIDYSELEHWMAHADQVIRDTRRTLDALGRSEGAPAAPRSRAAPTLQSQQPSDDLPESWLGGNGMDDHE